MDKIIVDGKVISILMLSLTKDEKSQPKTWHGKFEAELPNADNISEATEILLSQNSKQARIVIKALTTIQNNRLLVRFKGTGAPPKLKRFNYPHGLERGTLVWPYFLTCTSV